MAQKHLFEFPCPCCGKRVELDTRTGKVRAVRSADQPGGFDELLRGQDKEADRLTSAFNEAARDVRSSPDRLDRLFDEAQEDARKNPDRDDGLRRPFDLD